MAVAGGVLVGGKVCKSNMRPRTPQKLVLTAFGCKDVYFIVRLFERCQNAKKRPFVRCCNCSARLRPRRRVDGGYSYKKIFVRGGIIEISDL